MSTKYILLLNCFKFGQSFIFIRQWYTEKVKNRCFNYVIDIVTDKESERFIHWFSFRITDMINHAL